METFRGPQLVQGQRIGTDFTSRSSGRGTLSQSYRSAMQGASARNVRVQCTASDCGALLEVESPTNRTARRPEQKKKQHSTRATQQQWLDGWRQRCQLAHAQQQHQPFHLPCTPRSAPPSAFCSKASQQGCHCYAALVPHVCTCGPETACPLATGQHHPACLTVKTVCSRMCR